MSKAADEFPIEVIRRCLDGANRDNCFYQYLLGACDIIEELRKECNGLKGQGALFP